MVNIKSTSNAIWWIKNPRADAKGEQRGGIDEGGARNNRARRKSVGSGFCHDMADLLRNISLHGYNKLVSLELTLGERLIWLLVHVVTFVTLLVLVSLTWEQFVAQYFVINLKEPLYPIENVPFPAVSICSNNRLSLQAVTKYAQELHQQDPSARSLDYFINMLKNLNHLYRNTATLDFDELERFQIFLDLFGTWENETFYDTRRIMKQLAPRCEDFILKCTLANVEIPCFSNTTFQTSLTTYGPCCTFNKGNTLQNRNFKNRLATAELGLTIILNTSTEDYLTPVMNTHGYIVMAHTPENYASSNSLTFFPGHNEESFFEVTPRVVDSDANLRSFSPTTRQCYFYDEAPIQEILTLSSYTFGNCITRCRIRSVIALCSCFPFYLPLELLETLDGIVYCSLNHVACIREYDTKWRSVLTVRQNIPGLEREMEEALYCPSCLPSCNDVQYKGSLHSLPIDNYLKNKQVTIQNATDFHENISVLHVYFGQFHAHLYIRLLNNAWFEVFSTIGNILSIFMGFSLVAIFESLYFVVKYLFICFMRMREQSNRGKHNNKNTENPVLNICP